MTSTIHHWNKVLRILPLTAAILLIAAAGFAFQGGRQGPAKSAAASRPPSEEGWIPMFDGKTLDGWAETDFSGKGKVTVEDGAIILWRGVMTGVNYTKPFPQTNYEIRLEACRKSGSDFFAGITFPVKNSFLTWINGGWGGSLVGLSSLDYMDASENDTGTTYRFENGRWYKLYLSVNDKYVQAWIDDEQIIGTNIEDRTVGLRYGEIELSKPIGFASYWTVAALRNIQYRVVAPPPEN